MIYINKNRKPFFSVIICTYNRAYILDKAIESLIAQTEHDWEAIVVDDGSKDNTSQLVMDFVKRDPRIRYIYQSHRGLALSRNAGILASAGMICTFLDSDDEYLPEHLDLRKRIILQNPDVELLHGGVEIVGDKYVEDVLNPGKKIHIDECVVGGTFCFRPEKAIEIGGFQNIEYGDDLDFFNRGVESGWTIARNYLPTYKYNRELPDSLCNQKMRAKE